MRRPNLISGFVYDIFLVAGGGKKRINSSADGGGQRFGDEEGHRVEFQAKGEKKAGRKIDPLLEGVGGGGAGGDQMMVGFNGHGRDLVRDHSYNRRHESTASLLDTIEKRTQKTYRYGIGLVCIGATLNWLGFAQARVHSSLLNY